MKKVVSIVAVVAFAIGIYTIQADKMDFDFSIENILACGDCGENEDPRGGNGLS